MNIKSFRYLSTILFVGIVVFSVIAYRLHLGLMATHTIPFGLYEFKVTDPPPECGRWREHMPRERGAQPYYLYKRARNFWRSKLEFEFTRSELTSVFTDVKAASDQGDWGAKALLSHFYLEGLGPLDTNVVQKSDP